MFVAIISMHDNPNMDIRQFTHQSLDRLFDFTTNLSENRGHTSRRIKADNNINRVGDEFHVVSPFLDSSSILYPIYLYFSETREEEESDEFLDIPMDTVETSMCGQLYRINEVASMLLTNVLRKLYPQACVITCGKHAHA